MVINKNASSTWFWICSLARTIWVIWPETTALPSMTSRSRSFFRGMRGNWWRRANDSSMKAKPVAPSSRGVKQGIVTAQQNHQRSLHILRRDHQRSLAMTQPSTLGMTQPRTRNPVKPRLPQQRPHLQRHPSRPRPRPNKHATPAPSHYHLTPKLPSRATAQRPHHTTTMAAASTVTPSRVNYPYRRLTYV